MGDMKRLPDEKRYWHQQKTLVLALFTAGLVMTGCAKWPEECGQRGAECPGPVRINELMADNEGAWVDELGESDDWLELINTSEVTVDLGKYALGDTPGSRHQLPSIALEPGEIALLWADDDPEQGANHLPFKLSSRGETVYLYAPSGHLADMAAYPTLGPNQSYARSPDGRGTLSACAWPSPLRDNGDSCGPPPPPDMPAEVVFAPYRWPDPWPASAGPLLINEMALRPAKFIEVLNMDSDTIDLSAYLLTISGHTPGQEWPGIHASGVIPWPIQHLPAGERIAVAVNAEVLGDLADDPDFEGVVSLWNRAQQTVIERVDFMSWPEGAVLSRIPDEVGKFQFCREASEAIANHPCDPLAAREVSNRLRHLYTPGDFAALAQGGAALGIESVKFVVDMEAGNTVHLLDSRAYDLHYTFVREEIEALAHLDRCDPDEGQLFRTGWSAFSKEQYYQIEGRRYLLGTLQHYVGNNLKTMEFTTGDRIVAYQMRQAFFTVAAHLLRPTQWALRPQSGQQVMQMQSLPGKIPVVDANAPFRGVTFQAMTEGVTFGTLRFVPAGELTTAPLGVQTIVLCDLVPDDIPLTGGLITEAFQAPLSHVNVLSRNRGKPNMVLYQARKDPRVSDLLDQLVRLEVSATGFDIRLASIEEAEAFWESLQTQADPLRPRLDTRVRDLRMLTDSQLSDLPALGAKAAQLAELGRVRSADANCPGPLNLPQNAFAIPLVHSLEHYQASGASDLLLRLQDDPLFRSDPWERALRLAEVQSLILSHPLEKQLLKTVTTQVEELFGEQRVRFRSSSNTEDLPGFNGAGLYHSLSAQLGDPDRSIETAMRMVWASLYYARAYEERRYFNVEESGVAMGILVHQAFRKEKANGVAISRNIINPIRSDQYYFNNQVGEASVTHPAPGVSSEQRVFRWNKNPAIIDQSYSSLPGGQPVLSNSEIAECACQLRQIHAHFRPLLDPQAENRWFAIDIEFKLIDPERNLIIKQARPYTFGNATFSEDCREF